MEDLKKEQYLKLVTAIQEKKEEILIFCDNPDFLNFWTKAHELMEHNEHRDMALKYKKMLEDSKVDLSEDVWKNDPLLEIANFYFITEKEQIAFEEYRSKLKECGLLISKLEEYIEKSKH